VSVDWGQTGEGGPREGGREGRETVSRDGPSLLRASAPAPWVLLLHPPVNCAA